MTLNLTWKRLGRIKKPFDNIKRNLPFSEKMQIAFSLAERDKMIRRAFLLPKRKKENK